MGRSVGSESLGIQLKTSNYLSCYSLQSFLFYKLSSLQWLPILTYFDQYLISGQSFKPVTFISLLDHQLFQGRLLWLNTKMSQYMWQLWKVLWWYSGHSSLTSDFREIWKNVTLRTRHHGLVNYLIYMTYHNYSLITR